MSLFVKISELPGGPQPPITWKVSWVAFVGSMVGVGITAILAFTWKWPFERMGMN
ncbi:tRNA and rRNA cytosine-C5-methylase [Candidatus Scalindua japonica]|uniref:tRNA and rRNA cytosine-C5-methylase n=1 Tax=Candidatus Scalindua japonica TaxID=1284222 RepID=A0A286TZM2_9BACT|nr:hypothetical protein [Candidatus Scalindua japonica]GAX61327.1 tRNA and rRNA cytosine-C5-methylase [Candidatus Scalindua japonica]